MTEGTWLGDERIINGIGLVKPGKISLPANMAANFEQQGLFKPSKAKPTVKEVLDDVRADN